MKTAETRREELKETYRTVFRTDAGKAVLKDMMRRAKVLTPITTGNSETTAFYDGQRSVVLTILNILRVPEDDVDLVRQAIGKEPLDLLFPDEEKSDD